ncbi:MAG: two-component system response regulator, partial [Acidobacteria bacterium]
TLEEMERTMIQQALEQTGWNQTRAAHLLGISRDSIRYKMRKYGIEEKK